MLRRVLQIAGVLALLAFALVAALLGHAHWAIRGLGGPLPTDLSALDAPGGPVRIAWINTSRQVLPRAQVLDPRRDPTLICVVEESKDVVAIERTREFKGRYHVLGGAISPLEGIGPEQLRIRELIARLEDGQVTEIILATDPNIEGDATAAYLTRMLRPMGLQVTRLASGLPVGGDLEYADEVTLGRAFAGRRSAGE